MRFVSIKLFLILLPFSAQLSLESQAFAQQDQSPSQSLSGLAKANWHRGYLISVGSHSISIQATPIRDRLISSHPDELSNIEISLDRGPFGSHPIRLRIRFEGRDLSKEIRLDTDGEDLNLKLVDEIGLSLSLRTVFSTQYDLSQEDYQRLVRAKTLAIKGGGSTFLLTGEHIKALKGFAEAGVGFLKSP